jgi:hypothetical protein
MQIYHQTYCAEKKPEALIATMLENFLGADAGFGRT